MSEFQERKKKRAVGQCCSGEHRRQSGKEKKKKKAATNSDSENARFSRLTANSNQMQLDGAKPVFEKKVATVLCHFGSMIGESRTRSLTLDCLLLFGHETEAGLLRHQAWTMENTSDVIGAGRLATVAMGTDCQAHDSMDL